MTLLLPRLAIAFAAFAVLAPLLRPQNSPVQPVPLSSKMARISDDIKKRAGGRRLNRQVKGITSMVTLTPHQSFIPNKAYLKYSNVKNGESGSPDNANGFFVGASSGYTVDHYGMTIRVTYEVVSPQKAHVLTFYVSGQGQDYMIDDQKFKAMSGDHAFPYAVIPSTAGPHTTYIRGLGLTWTFYKVEIDVVE